MRGQPGEADDISEQYGDVVHRVHVERPEDGSYVTLREDIGEQRASF